MTASSLEPIPLKIDQWIDAPTEIIQSLIAAAPEGLTFDASGSAAIPAQVAQLLLAAQHTVLAQGKPFGILNPSEAVESSLTALGLADLLLKGMT